MDDNKINNTCSNIESNIIINNDFVLRFSDSYFDN